MEGTIPALLTPFTAGGAEVDLGLLDAHIGWLHERGIRTVSPMGTTGEGASLSLSERKRLIERLARHPSGVGQIPGTGCTNLPETIELSRFAVEHGAEGVLIAPPTYYVPDGAGAVTDYYARVLEALQDAARVVLYHIPGQTRVAIELETIRELHERFGPKVAGVKDSGRDFDHTVRLIREFPGVAILNGSDPLVARSYAAGGPGVISATANVLPEEYEAIRGGNEASQGLVTAVRTLADSAPRHAALKLLLHLISGLPRSLVRPPLRELEDAEADLLRARFAELRAGASV